jgi:NADH-quinone oxidoreductase subunit K
MISITHFLVLSALLFSISLAGVVINRKNLIVLLMCVELMLLAVNTNFIVFSQYLHAGEGEIFVFFILAVAAAESAIGLAILVLFFRQRKSINVDDMSTLNG